MFSIDLAKDGVFWNGRVEHSKTEVRKETVIEWEERERRKPCLCYEYPLYLKLSVIIQRNGNCSAWKEPSVYLRPKAHYVPKWLQVRLRQRQNLYSSGLQATAWEKNSLTDTVHTKEPTKMTSVFHPLTMWTGGKKIKDLEVQGVRRNIKINYPTKRD